MLHEGLNKLSLFISGISFFSNFDKYFSSRYLKTGLERKLEFTALDDNVGEIQQVDL